ncbi:MAG: NDP-sugar synthase [Oligoflexales bacterium]|nr:NDP-sugar synthase [Oligoflexales bacterium]
MAPIKQNLSAVLLAAGFGQRLRELTRNVPKPLLEVFSVPLLEWQLLRLEQAGFQKIAVNTHYKAECIDSFLTKQYRHVYTSHEQNAPLGTGGVFIPLLSWLGDEAFLVTNSDIIANIDLLSLIQQHHASQSILTMALLEKPLPKETKIYVNKGRVVQIGGAEDSAAAKASSAHGFACAYVVDPRFKRYLEGQQVPFSIVESMRAALGNGEEISAFIHGGSFVDLGTPEKYLETCLKLLSLRDLTAIEEFIGCSLAKAKSKGDFLLNNEDIVDKGWNPKQVKSPVYISHACKKESLPKIIGPDVVINGSCELGELDELRNAVVVNDGKIDRKISLVKNAIVGKDFLINL